MSAASSRALTGLAALVTIASWCVDADAQVARARDPMIIWMPVWDHVATDLTWRGPAGERATFRCDQARCVSSDWFHGAGRYELRMPAQGTWPAFAGEIALRGRDVQIQIRLGPTGAVGLSVGSRPRGVRVLRDLRGGGWLLQNRTGRALHETMDHGHIRGLVEEWRYGAWDMAGVPGCGNGDTATSGVIVDGGSVPIAPIGIEDAPIDGRSWRVRVRFNHSFVGAFSRYDVVTVDGAVW